MRIVRGVFSSVNNFRQRASRARCVIRQKILCACSARLVWNTSKISGRAFRARSVLYVKSFSTRVSRAECVMRQKYVKNVRARVLGAECVIRQTTHYVKFPDARSTRQNFSCARSARRLFWCVCCVPRLLLNWSDVSGLHRTPFV